MKVNSSSVNLTEPFVTFNQFYSIFLPLFLCLFYFLLRQATFVPVFQLFRGTSEKLDFIVMFIFMFLVN